VTAPGVISLVVKTGCRPPSPDFDPSAEPGAARSTLAAATLTVIGARTERELPGAAVPCPGGGFARTWRVIGSGDLGPAQRRRLSVGTVVVDAPAEMAVRSGLNGFRIRKDGDRLAVAFTETCARQ